MNLISTSETKRKKALHYKVNKNIFVIPSFD